MKPRFYYHDRQQDPPVGYCRRCKGEIYNEEDFCPKCQEERRRFDQETVQEMMEEADHILKKWLSDDLRNEFWNYMVTKFPFEED